MKIRTAVMAAVCAFGLYSCSGDGEADGGAASGLPSVTVVTSAGGLGDMGYNDLIMAGVMRFYDKGGVRMSLVQPTGMAQAGQTLYAWMENTRGGGRSLLVLADDGYGELLRGRDVALAPNQSILLFESGGDSLPAGVTTFSIDRYGASWLAGSMCREHPSATVIAAMPGNSTLRRAIDGFSDGYSAVGGAVPEVIYLSDGEEGFAMADSAYRLASRLERTVILPLAGGSNGGVYKASREVFALTMVIGMDADCSLRCQNLPFSLVVRVDSLVETYLSDWLKGQMVAGHRSFGLAEGATGIVFTPGFYDNADFLENYFAGDRDYWTKACASFMDEAIRKEKEYESR